MKNKSIKNILKILVVLLLLINVPVFADTTIEDRKVEIASEIVDIYLEELESDLKIKGFTPLYSDDELVAGFWFHLSNNNNTGYMIVYPDNGILKVTEFSVHSDLKIPNTGKIYYGGLNSYFIKSNGKYINMLNNSVVDRINSAPKVDVNATKKIINNLKTNAVLRAPVSFGVGSHSLDYTVNKINQNDATPNGGLKCMQTSAAMLLDYWDTYKAPFKNLTDYSGAALVNYLESNYIPLSGNKTLLSDLVSGLRNYISDRRYGHGVLAHSSDLDNDTLPENFILDVASEIDHERPCIVIIGSEAVEQNGNTLNVSGATMHALLVKGTRTVGGVDYLVTIDPFDKGEKSIAWDPYNWAERDYFAIYSVVTVEIMQ